MRCKPAHEGGWIGAEVPVQHDMAHGQRRDAGGDGPPPLFQQGQFGGQHRYRFGRVFAALRTPRSAFPGGGQGLRRLAGGKRLGDLQGIRTARFPIDQRYGQEREAGEGAARQARIEPTQPVRRLSRLADHHVIASQQLRPVRVQPGGSHHHPPQQGPIERGLIPALQRPTTPACLTPPRQAQRGHPPRNT
jgi:hypothetical protein